MKDDLVDVFTAGNGMEAQLLVARLSDQGIQAFADNNDSPLAGLTAAEQTVPVRVLAKDEAMAKPIVDEFMREQGWEAAADDSD